MKIPLVKEWGSWAVFFTSCAAGLAAGFRSEPFPAGRPYEAVTFLTVLGFAFLINSKNPLAAAIRSKGKKEHVVWSLAFALAGLAMLIPFLKEGFSAFIVFAVLIATYAAFLISGKEHHIMAELNGFALLTVSSPAVYFAVTGQMSWKLYLAVTMFFSAGVFKVRMRLKRNVFYRWMMGLYCSAASGIFLLVNIPVILLLPLVDNVVSALFPGQEKLRATGYTELVKGVIFIVLVWHFWR